MDNRTSIADRIIDALTEADDDLQTRIWSDRDGIHLRVYVSRGLSRGRRQDMGYAAVADDGDVICAFSRRAAYLTEIVREAL